MQLYFSPLACSMATRIAFYETGRPATFTEVDPITKRLLHEDADFRAINPLGLVPTLRTPDGEVLTENAAILQYVGGELAPHDGLRGVRLQQWLCFVGTELHKGLFAPLLDPKAPAEMKAYVIAKGMSRLAMLEQHLTGREFLLDQFTVADAYLVTVLNWAIVTPVELAAFPAITAYAGRLRQRPSVARAMREERELYVAELARHRA